MIEVVSGLLAGRGEPVVVGSVPPERQGEDARGTGVSLRRLLAIAALTPAQASWLITDALDQLELARSRGRLPILFRDDAVTVFEEGELTIEFTGRAASWREISDAMADLLGSIAANCRGSALVDRIHESITEARDLDDVMQRVRRAIAPDIDPAAEERTRRQLGALVSATLGRQLSDGREAGEERTPRGRRPGVAGASLATGDWFPPVRSPWHRRKRRLSRRRGALGLIAIVVLAGALWTAPRVWSELRRGWDAVLNPVNPSGQNQIAPVSPPPPEPTGDPGAPAPGGQRAEPISVEVGAPASAGIITLVTATLANGECTSGRACDIRVDVHFDSAPNEGTVVWKLNVYDRCSGEVRTGNEVSLHVPPGAQQVYGIGRTDLPPSTALAVAAVTSFPATAASEPVLMPAENASC
ncbi:hypothetical protein L1080_009495 [Rhodococcus sp. MSC1_016]|jgi:hypothetical protein|uniref:hypothetical protein n=1 Tax=Rhodococcus sp. MSC1_016 TaxID=2909266 RepID=UPI00202FA01A|nr:hypothetical protein [Rhodococcus sp. MSC1_016]